uniref:FLYWCH-type domain-containing protein n=1 Tax=Trichuris muris TaxID=70415 RepID=A0A5S6QBP8_TRIMR
MGPVTERRSAPIPTRSTQGVGRPMAEVPHSSLQREQTSRQGGLQNGRGANASVPVRAKSLNLEKYGNHRRLRVVRNVDMPVGVGWQKCADYGASYKLQKTYCRHAVQTCRRIHR